MRDSAKEFLQYICAGIALAALALIPWFLDEWWKLLIVAVVATFATGGISVERGEK